MKIYNKFVLFLFILIFCSPIVKADTCDANDIAELKELAKRVTVDYEYTGDREDSTDIQEYTVKFSGLGSDFYILYEGSIYRNGEVIYAYSGKNSFDVYSYKCDRLARIIEVDLLVYNSYSEDNICYGYEDKIEECYKWYQGDTNEKDIENKIEEFNSKNNPNFKKEVVNVTYNILTNYWPFLSVSLILIIVLFILIRRKRYRLD